MKNLIMSVFLAVSVGAVYGDGVSALSQTDLSRGPKVCQTTALLSANLEVWHFDGPGNIEIGRLKVADAGKGRLSLVGGYLSFSEKFDNISLEAFGVHDRQVGDWRLHAAGGVYSPRSDGSCGWIAFSPETRLTKSAGKGLEVGVAGDLWWIESVKFDVRVGPYGRVEGKDGAMAVRYFHEDRQWRLEVCMPIK